MEELHRAEGEVEEQPDRKDRPRGEEIRRLQGVTRREADPLALGLRAHATRLRRRQEAR